MRRFWYAWLAVLICLGVLTVITLAAQPGTEVGAAMNIAKASLFDLGVTDVNGDGNLDIFTVNHGSPQSVLLGDGNGNFVEIGPELGLDYDSRFPGLADADEEPELKEPGLYIYWHDSHLVIRAVAVNQLGPARGKLSTYSPVEVKTAAGIEAEVAAGDAGAGVPHSTVRFEARQNGSLELYFRLAAQPIRFEIDPSFPVASIYIGHQLVNPSGNAFDLDAGDRHGMAWADYNGDGAADVFIARGGLRGMLDRLPVTLRDELFMRSRRGFKNVAAEAGLHKDGCSGRQAAWVDFDEDGLLDIYVGCDAVEEAHPNQLFRQRAGGGFAEIGKEVGLAVHSGESAWFDVDDDGDVDLFWIDRNGASVYRNEGGALIGEGVSDVLPSSEYEKLSIADFDLDGDLDVFAASVSGNALFVNDEGRYRFVSPAESGLPAVSATANWIDFDNDGLTDLHAVPGGLYKQIVPGRFEKDFHIPDLLPSKLSLTRIQTAIASWFDADNDGDRDLVVALTYEARRGTPYRWFHNVLDAVGSGLDERIEVRYFPNTWSDNHWLQLELTGPAGNAPALGAKVEVSSSSRTQMQFVGHAEGSHYSQGHYRMYFGLGSDPQPRSVKIIWPDGAVQMLDRVAPDQILRVTKDAEAIA